MMITMMMMTMMLMIIMLMMLMLMMMMIIMNECSGVSKLPSLEVRKPPPRSSQDRFGPHMMVMRRIVMMVREACAPKMDEFMKIL